MARKPYGAGPEDFKQAEWVGSYTKDWRYDFSTKSWHHWDGVRWAKDETGQSRKMVADLAAENIADAPTDNERKAVLKLFNLPSIDRALEALSTMDGYGTDGSDWDQVPYLLGCLNGVVDLRLNALIETPTPDLLITKSTGSDFHPVASPDDFHRVAPHFMEFMDQITSEDPGMVGFLLLWFGASMFGFSPEQRFLLMTGIGRNGKGALKHAIMKAIGQYGVQPDANLYMRSKMGGSRSESARADLMDIKGRRVAFFSEPEGNRFNEEMLKAHTGGDIITARALYSNTLVSWEPTHSITFLVNNAPEVEDLGPSMGARVMVADFRERYDGEKEDKTLYRKLESEHNGILAILCWAAQAWYKSWDSTGAGIEMPERVLQASKAFMERGDQIAAFINDTMDYDPKAEIQSKVLYERYQNWHATEDRADDAMSQTKFGTTLERKGYKRVKRSAGHYYVGLSPLNAMELAERGLLGEDE